MVVRAGFTSAFCVFSSVRLGRSRFCYVMCVLLKKRIEIIVHPAYVIVLLRFFPSTIVVVVWWWRWR